MDQRIDTILNNKDFMSIAHKAAQPFFRVLSKQEIDYSITNAIWNSLRFYDNGKKTKYETYLYRGVTIECIKQKRIGNYCSIIHKKRLENGLRKSYRNIPSKYNHVEQIDMIDEVRNCEDPELIYDRFYKNSTLTEIATKRGVTKEAIRLKIKKNLQIMKNNCTFSV